MTDQVATCFLFGNRVDAHARTCGDCFMSVSTLAGGKSRINGCSSHSQTQSHYEVEDHNDFRVTPVVVNQSAGKETSETAQRPKNNTPLDPQSQINATIIARRPVTRCVRDTFVFQFASHLP